MEYPEFDKIRLDAFREIGSMAMENAAKSLSILLGSRVDIGVPNVMMEELKEIPELLGGRDKMVSVVYFVVSGQISGSILLVISEAESLKLAGLLTRQDINKIEDLDEMGLSALKEFGNIVTGSYVKVLAEGLKISFAYSVPGFSCDMLGAILDEILACISFDAECAAILESEFMVRAEAYGGYLIFVLTPKAVGDVVKALGMLGE